MKYHPKLSPVREHFPLASLVSIICGFPVSLWGACSPHLFPSARYGGMGTFCAHPCTPHALHGKSCMHRSTKGDLVWSLGVSSAWGEQLCAAPWCKHRDHPESCVRHRGYM